MPRCEYCDKEIDTENEEYARSVDPIGNDDSLYYTCSECMEEDPRPGYSLYYTCSECMEEDPRPGYMDDYDSDLED